MRGPSFDILHVEIHEGDRHPATRGQSRHLITPSCDLLGWCVSTFGARFKGEGGGPVRPTE